MVKNNNNNTFNKVFGIVLMVIVIASTAFYFGDDSSKYFEDENIVAKELFCSLNGEDYVGYDRSVNIFPNRIGSYTPDVITCGNNTYEVVPSSESVTVHGETSQPLYSDSIESYDFAVDGDSVVMTVNGDSEYIVEDDFTISLLAGLTLVGLDKK